MTATPPARPATGEVLSVVGEQIRILADGAMTGGKFLVFEESGPPGGGPPLHRHDRDDEFFTILEGAMKFVVDGVTRVVGPGDTMFAPKGSVHTFVNVGSTRHRMLVVCCPAGLEGPFRACDAMEREGRVTPEAVTAAFRAFELHIVGPPLTP